MRRLLALVAAVVLVDTMFYAAIPPLLPHYADELGLSKSAAGLLSAAYPAGGLIGALPAGWLAARAGVKPTLLAGLGLIAATSLVFGFAGDIVVLDTARFVQGFGGACCWSAGLAWLVAVAPDERRGEMIGSALAAAIAGVMLGPVLGGLGSVAGPEPVFAGVAAAAIGLAAWAARIPAVPPAPAGGTPLVRAIRRGAVLAGLWFVALPALFAGVLDVLAPLRLDDLGASGVGVGAVFLVAAGVESVVSAAAGRMSDRRGRLAPMRAGLAGAVVMALVLPLPDVVALEAVAVVAAVAALGTFWAPAMALLSEAADAAGLDQGYAFALTNLAWGAGQVVGGAAGAGVADATADAVPYAALAVICAVTLTLVARRRVAVGIAT